MGRTTREPTKLSRRRATEILKTDRTPLDVMLENMNFWWDRARELGGLLEEQLKSENEDIRRAAMRTVGPFLAARDNAQRCAVDAAPYVHPKFSSIAFRANTGEEMTVTMTLAPAKGEDEDRSYREEIVKATVEAYSDEPGEDGAEQQQQERDAA
jgi:hypothetical protein